MRCDAAEDVILWPSVMFEAPLSARWNLLLWCNENKGCEGLITRRYGDGS